MWSNLFGVKFCRKITNQQQQFFSSTNSVWSASNYRRKQSEKSNITINRQQQAYTTNFNSKMHDCLPFFAKGEIVHGFGRGSKELGIPTANYPLEVVKSLPAALITGIYYGWANVDNGDVHKMVMSIGTNPYYDNKEKSMETHIMHKFDRDLYGCLLKVCIVGYLRPETNFTSLDELITAIQNDIAQAETLLDATENSRKLKDSVFFKSTNCENSDNAPKPCNGS